MNEQQFKSRVSKAHRAMPSRLDEFRSLKDEIMRRVDEYVWRLEYYENLSSFSAASANQLEGCVSTSTGPVTNVWAT